MNKLMVTVNRSHKTSLRINCRT